MHTDMTIDTAPKTATKVTPTGICAGTTIMTLDGEKAIEDVKAGDRIITRDSGMSVVQDITMTRATMQTVRIKAGSLGHNRPDRDMIVAPGAKLHIRDWRAEALFGTASASVSAERLVDGEFLALNESASVATFKIIFDREHIVYADGIEIIAGA